MAASHRRIDHSGPQERYSVNFCFFCVLYSVSLRDIFFSPRGGEPKPTFKTVQLSEVAFLPSTTSPTSGFFLTAVTEIPGTPSSVRAYLRREGEGSRRRRRDAGEAVSDSRANFSKNTPRGTSIGNVFMMSPVQGSELKQRCSFVRRRAKPSTESSGQDSLKEKEGGNRRGIYILHSRANWSLYQRWPRFLSKPRWSNFTRCSETTTRRRLPLSSRYACAARIYARVLVHENVEQQLLA